MRLTTILFLTILLPTLASAADCNKFVSFDINGTKYFQQIDLNSDTNGTILCGYKDYNTLSTDFNYFKTQCNDRINTEKDKVATAESKQGELQTANDSLTTENTQLKQTNLDLNNEYISKVNSILATLPRNTEAITALNTTTTSWILGDKAAYEQKITQDNKTVLDNIGEIKYGIIAVIALIAIFLCAKYFPKLTNRIDANSDIAKQKAQQKREQQEALLKKKLDEIQKQKEAEKNATQNIV